MGRPFYRVKQFLATYKSKLSYSEVEFVRKHLGHQGQILFYRMQGFDQRHALMVAHKCLEKTRSTDWVDENVMAKSALLHDVGKSSKNIGVLSRVLYVMLSSIKEGKFLDKFEKRKSIIPFRDNLFILHNHGPIGANMLMDVGVQDRAILETLATHHEKPSMNENKMLPILREVDGQL